jgi:hypothetical protein
MKYVEPTKHRRLETKGYYSNEIKVVNNNLILLALLKKFFYLKKILNSNMEITVENNKK